MGDLDKLVEEAVEVDGKDRREKWPLQARLNRG